MKNAHHFEVLEGRRFQFGQNWRHFLGRLDEPRIAIAEQSLRELLEVKDLQGRKMLDVGSGSGLFSLAAWRLGADVLSFDYDPESVGCTTLLRQQFNPENEHWRIEQGSALDESWMRSLGQFDIVYSWGVLHHTGSMWRALGNVAENVAPGGLLCLAIYNDQEWRSRLWLRVKRFYCSSKLGKTIVVSLYFPNFMIKGLLFDLLHMRNPLRRYKEYRKNRGMSIIHDWLDWLGGLPFEVAKPEEIIRFYRDRGFMLRNLVTCGGSEGNNQFVFLRSRESAAVDPSTHRS